MKCPYCGHEQDKVVDSRASKEGQAVRRRRECMQCHERFTTYEYIENVSLSIIKNDKRREPFDRQKLLTGIVTACKKRPISLKRIEQCVDKITETIESMGVVEIPSSKIGELVIHELSQLDDVAYVRFASVYRNFRTRDEFISEIQGMNIRNS